MTNDKRNKIADDIVNHFMHKGATISIQDYGLVVDYINLAIHNALNPKIKE